MARSCQIMRWHASWNECGEPGRSVRINGRPDHRARRLVVVIAIVIVIAGLFRESQGGFLRGIEVSSMSWSWKLGRVAGIPIYIHWTFVILIASIVLGYWVESHNLITALEGGGFILSLFGCVVLHELGHALRPAGSACRPLISRSCRSAEWRGCSASPNGQSRSC